MVLSGIGFRESLVIQTLYMIAMLGLVSVECRNFFFVYQ